MQKVKNEISEERQKSECFLTTFLKINNLAPSKHELQAGRHDVKTTNSNGTNDGPDFKDRTQQRGSHGCQSPAARAFPASAQLGPSYPRNRRRGGRGSRAGKTRKLRNEKTAAAKLPSQCRRRPPGSTPCLRRHSRTRQALLATPSPRFCCCLGGYLAPDA